MGRDFKYLDRPRSQDSANAMPMPSLASLTSAHGPYRPMNAPSCRGRLIVKPGGRGRG